MSPSHSGRNYSQVGSGASSKKNWRTLSGSFKYNDNPLLYTFENLHSCHNGSFG